jgi:hypothetical protein
MPSSKNYKRDYKQERKTAKRRGETGAGSKSGDATRHRARRKKLKSVKNKRRYKNKDVDHKKSLKSGGSNKKSNLRWASKKSNRSKGGKIGNRSGKAVRKKS